MFLPNFDEGWHGEKVKSWLVLRTFSVNDHANLLCNQSLRSGRIFRKLRLFMQWISTVIRWHIFFLANAVSFKVAIPLLAFIDSVQVHSKKCQIYMCANYAISMQRIWLGLRTVVNVCCSSWYLLFLVFSGNHGIYSSKPLLPGLLRCNIHSYFLDAS